MRTDDNNSNYLIAAEGKVLRRLSDGWVSGSEIYLGYAYQLNGEQLAEPMLELAEHYEEIDLIIEEATDEDFDVVAHEPVVMLLSEMTLVDELQPVAEPPKQVTLADLLVRALTEIEKLKKEVDELKVSHIPVRSESKGSV